MIIDSGYRSQVFLLNMEPAEASRLAALVYRTRGDLGLKLLQLFLELWDELCLIEPEMDELSARIVFYDFVKIFFEKKRS